MTQRQDSATRSEGAVTQRHLITSALPYINGVKHLGNLVGSMLPADVYARYLRARGQDVLFICATDEHGTPAELAAREAGMPVAEYCAQQYAIQKELGERFRISWDHFGRSSSSQNHALTRHFARKLEENGLIEVRTTRQVYSEADERYLPDRYVIGTCPHCGYDRARGDQCENCTRVLDPTDLVEPRSAISGSSDLVARETDHLFLLQSRLVDRLRAWIESKRDWPVLVSSIALKWLDEGLRDRGITRDLDWGVPVDREGFEDKVYYVWFDAPIEYIAATKEWADEDPEPRDWKSWWWEADDVRYTEFMAKDNVPFHTIGFPSTLMGSGEPWKLVDYIKGFNWLTYYGGKFSTSQGRGVFMDHALELLPPDYWRYFLVANAPEGGDAAFSWELFQAVVNKDLADVFGNFVNRALTFTSTRYVEKIPSGGEWGEAEEELAAELSERLAALTTHMDQLEMRKSTQELRAIWASGNKYFDRTEPWAVFKRDPDAAAITLRTAINLIRVCAIVAWPILPDTSEKVFSALSLDEQERVWPSSNGRGELTRLEAGRSFQAPGEVLFRKVSDDEVMAWRERFGAEEESTNT